MKKQCFFFFLLLLIPFLLVAQQRTLIRLERSEFLVGSAAENQPIKVKKPVFKHDNAILTCDSAHFYEKRNYFEAFGNVHINQGDTIHIYSDLLNYDGNEKKAYLIDRVRMSDPTSVLTTNKFDYNMASKVGTYLQNGKIVNKEATIVSKHGYYFANSRDAYFRHSVVVTTPQAIITSDTLRYNTFSNWAYFYGPTNIKGKDDHMYTENGAYNTKEENAYFGKNNLYTQNSKSLRGDSLYYYGKRGYGKAVKNIFFHDSEDKLELRGHLGEYYKEDQRVVVTLQPYVGIASTDSITVNGARVPDTLWLGADTLEAQMVLQKSLKLIPKAVVLSDDEVVNAEENREEDSSKEKPPVGTPPADDPKKTTDSLKKELNEPPGKLPSSLSTDSLKMGDIKKTDSLGLLLKDKAPPDSLLKKISKADSVQVDTSKKNKDTLLSKSAKTTDTLQKSLKNTDPSKSLKSGEIDLSALRSGGKKEEMVSDSIPPDPADTVRTRIIKAYHQVKVYKSNLQAKSDSLFFTAADSTLRWFNNPILWSDRSQQTGDTIYVQFQNKKINSVRVLSNAFIVNAEPDTTKFNQIKGKLITGFFRDGEIRTMYVDGNAESISYTKDGQEKYNNINQTVSARIRILFQDKDITQVKQIKGIEGAFTPIDKAPKEALLTGFIWKPEIKPQSKEDVTGRNKTSVKNPAAPVVTPKTEPKEKNGQSKHPTGNLNLEKTPPKSKTVSKIQ